MECFIDVAASLVIIFTSYNQIMGEGGEDAFAVTCHSRLAK